MVKIIVCRVWFFLLLSAVFVPFSGAAEPVPFFSEEELRQLAFPQAEWRQELSEYLESRRAVQIRGALQPKTMGPIISVLVPKVVEDKYIARVPLTLLVFLKKRQAPINMESLLVEGRRGYFALDITQKLRAFLRAPQLGEDADYVIDAEVPAVGRGNYLITMSIKDTLGNIEEVSAFLEVVE